MISRKAQVLLIFLRMEGERSSKELKHIYKSTSALVDNANYLIKAGFITKYKGRRKDKRLKSFELTPEGVKFTDFLLKFPDLKNEREKIENE